MRKIFRDILIVILCTGAAFVSFIFLRSIILTALLVYFIPNVWIFFHLKKVVRGRYLKIIVLLIFLLTALAFPAGEILENTNPSALSSFYLLSGVLYLPFLLYFVMLVPVTRLLLYLGSRFRIINLTGHSWLITSSVISAILSVAITAAGNYNFNHPRITKYEISLPAKKSQVRSLKLAMASDLHIGSTTGKKFMDRFLNVINSIDADVVLLPGDIMEGAGDGSDRSYFENKLSTIKSRYGVFASTGNHENYGRDGQEVRSFFSNSGIFLLEDTAVIIDNAFSLTGINDGSHEAGKMTAILDRFENDTLPSVVLNHRPENYDLIASHDIGLVLSGHTHDGQLWPFNYITKAVYELSWGHRTVMNTNFIVSCGAQGWGPPVRTAGYSEIVEITVKFY